MPSHSTIRSAKSLIQEGLGLFGGFEVYEVVGMTVTRPHILASERTLARVAGGRWFEKTETVPDPNLMRSERAIYGHPATIARLRQRLQQGRAA